MARLTLKSPRRARKLHRNTCGQHSGQVRRQDQELALLLLQMPSISKQMPACSQSGPQNGQGCVSWKHLDRRILTSVVLI